MGTRTLDLLLRSYPYPFVTACRARILRLEQQLKAVQPDPEVPRTWATTLVQDCSAVTDTPADAHLCGSGKGRRASCPEANVPSRSYRAHRQALEEQQRAATVFMSDKGKVRLRRCTDDFAHKSANQRTLSHRPNPQPLAEGSRRIPAAYCVLRCVVSSRLFLYELHLAVFV